MPLGVGLLLLLVSAVASVHVTQRVTASARAQPKRANSLDMCGVCVGVAGELAQLLAAGDSLAQAARSFADAGCAAFGDAQAECEAIVEHFGAAIASELGNGASATRACQSIRLCAKQHQSALVFASSATAAAASNECTACQSIFTFLDAFLAQNQTVTEIESNLDDLCAKFAGDYSGLCDNLVDAYVPQLVQLVETDASPSSACASIGFCSGVGKVVESFPPPPPPTSSPSHVSFECSACQFGVAALEQWVESNFTGNITSAAEQLCALVPTQYRSQCKLLVDIYVPTVIQLIAQKETPPQVCRKLTLCPKQHAATALESASAPLVASAHGGGGEQQVAFDQSAALLLAHNAGASNPACVLCETAIGFIESYAESNATEAALQAKLDALCVQFGGSSRVLCTNLVDAYLPQVMQYLERNESPAAICAQLALCASNARVEQAAAAGLASALARVGANNGGCALCKTVVTYVYVYVAHGQGQAIIQKQLLQLCSLTGSFASQCASLVNTNLPQILQWVTAMKTPQEICLLLQICVPPPPSPTTLLASSSGDNKQPRASAELCAACELVSALGEHYLESNNTLAQVQSQLDNLCTLYAGSEAQLCQLFVNAALPQIEAAVAKKIEPANLCSEFGLCSKSQQ